MIIIEGYCGVGFFFLSVEYMVLCQTQSMKCQQSIQRVLNHVSLNSSRTIKYL